MEGREARSNGGSPRTPQSPLSVARRPSRLIRSFSDDLSPNVESIGDLPFIPPARDFAATHMRRVSSTSALPRADPAVIRSYLRYKNDIVEAALLDREIIFTYNNEEIRLPVSRIIAVTTLQSGIKKKKSSHDDMTGASEAEDNTGLESEGGIELTASEAPIRQKGAINRFTSKVWRKKISAGTSTTSTGSSVQDASSSLYDSKSFPKLEKKTMPARVLTQTTHKAKPDAGSPAGSLYKTKKELQQEYDLMRSSEFSAQQQQSGITLQNVPTGGSVSEEGEPALTDSDSNYLDAAVAFVIHVAKVCESDFNQMKRKEYVFLSQTEDECVRWIAAIRKAISNEANRPKRLMVFVNPHGGKKRAAPICANKVIPLLKLAGIHTTLIETERAGHCTDVCQNADLAPYDGIVVVGGDGLFNEALNGLVHTKWTHLRVGLVPAGSTNTIVFSTTGAEDPVTSTLHIILGHRQALDVAAVFVDGKINRFAVSMLSYGFYGDVMKDSENFRWMGPVRYDYSGFKKYVGKTHYRAVVEYKEMATPSLDTLGRQLLMCSLCEAGCCVCPPDQESNSIFDFEKEEKEAREAGDSTTDPTWKSIDTKFVTVNAALMSCRCAKAPAGMSPYAHLSDGCLDLICVKGCSRPEYLQHLVRLTDPSKDHLDFPFIEVHKVTEFKLKCKEDNVASCWNIDGELLMTPDIHVKVYSNLVHLFAHRPEVNPVRPKIKPKRSKGVEPELLTETQQMAAKIKLLEEMLQVTDHRCDDLEKENDTLVDKVDTLEARMAAAEQQIQDLMAMLHAQPQ